MTTVATGPARPRDLDVFEVFAPARPPRTRLVVHPDDLAFFARHNALAGEPFALQTTETPAPRA